MEPNTSISHIRARFEEVGASFKDEKQPGQTQGHKYVKINNGEVIISEQKADFESLSNFINEIIQDKNINIEDKIEIVKVYKEITQKFKAKHSTWSSLFYDFFSGRLIKTLYLCSKADSLLHSFEKVDSLSMIYRRGQFDSKGELHGQGSKEYEYSEKFDEPKIKVKLTGTFENGSFINGKMEKVQGEEAKGEVVRKIIYNGQFKFDLLDGLGSVECLAPYPIRYTGIFKEGVLQEGEIVYLAEGNGKPTGTIYKGRFDKNGNLEGEGSIEYPNGSKVTGNFKDGKLEGDGLEIFVFLTPPISKAITQTVKGKYEKGKLTQGRIEYSTGAFDKGQFEKGRLHGEGERYYAGTTQRGIFENGKLTRGKVIEDDGTISEGEFRHDLLIGYGSKTYKEKMEIGIFKNDYLHGKGERKYSDGTIQKGEFEYGKLKKGKVIKDDGTISEGEFRHDLLNGDEIKLYKGFVTHLDGSKSRINPDKSKFQQDVSEVKIQPRRRLDISSSKKKVQEKVLIPQHSNLQHNSAIKIQALFRGYRDRQNRFQEDIKKNYDVYTNVASLNHAKIILIGETKQHALKNAQVIDRLYRKNETVLVGDSDENPTMSSQTQFVQKKLKLMGWDISSSRKAMNNIGILYQVLASLKTFINPETTESEKRRIYDKMINQLKRIEPNKWIGFLNPSTVENAFPELAEDFICDLINFNFKDSCYYLLSNSPDSMDHKSKEKWNERQNNLKSTITQEAKSKVELEPDVKYRKTFVLADRTRLIQNQKIEETLASTLENTKYAILIPKNDSSSSRELEEVIPLFCEKNHTVGLFDAMLEIYQFLSTSSEKATRFLPWHLNHTDKLNYSYGK